MNAVPPDNNAPVEVRAPGWLDRLSRTKENVVKTTYANVCDILQNDVDLKTLRYNTRTLQPEFQHANLDEQHIGAIRKMLERRYGVTPGLDLFLQAIMYVARTHSYDPVVTELNSLTWDGKHRLAGVAREILGNDGELEATMLGRMLIAAVARARQPGCQSDSQVVLYGPQGWRKSTFWKVLGGKYFRDTQLDIKNKDSVLQMRSSWIYEMPEVDALTSKKDASDVRAFLTIGVDHIRAPYERAVTGYPRAMVFVGTTNREDYLCDETGSRRFWTIEVRKPVDIALLSEWRDQLWAEADHLYKTGEQWWMTMDEDVARAKQSAQYDERDAWEPIIEKWLRLQNEPKDTTEIVTGALSIEKGKITRHDQVRVGKIMRTLGYDTVRPYASDGPRRRVYVKSGSDVRGLGHAVHDEESRSDQDSPQQECTQSVGVDRSNQFEPPHMRAQVHASPNNTYYIGSIGPIGSAGQIAGPSVVQPPADTLDRSGPHSGLPLTDLHNPGEPTPRDLTDDSKERSSGTN